MSAGRPDAVPAAPDRSEDGGRAGGAMSLAGILAAAEAAAPVESLDVVARMLRDHLGVGRRESGMNACIKGAVLV